MANPTDKQKQKQKETRRQEYKHKQDSMVSIRKDQFKRYPNMLFYPTSVVRRSKIPEKCFYDGTPLTWVNNIRRKGNPGWCCMRCLRHYLAPSQNSSPKNMSAAKPNGLLDLPDSPDFIPRTTILAAKLQAVKFGDIGWITIVSDVSDQNTSKGAFWIGRTLPSMALAAIYSEKHKRFEYKGITYRVTSFKPYPTAQKYLDIIGRFCNPTAPQTVYVFAQKNIGHFEQYNYESVTAMVPCANRLFPVPISVYYDKVKGTYFINDATYSRIRQQHGLPYMRLRTAVIEGGHSWNFSGLKRNSELNLLGYSVSSSYGLTTHERQNLLSEIIDSGILTKHEIMNHLEWLINTRTGQDHMDNAVADWKADLIFVSKYQAGTQRTIWVEKFKSKFSSS